MRDSISSTDPSAAAALTLLRQYADPPPCPSPTRGEGTVRRCIGRGTGSVISATRRRTDGCPAMEHRPRCVPSPLVGEGQGGGAAASAAPVNDAVEVEACSAHVES